MTREHRTPCLGCKFAKWKQTKCGRLHPSGDGRCTWTMPEIVLPISMYFFGAGSNSPRPSGGWISRHETPKHPTCPQFQPGEEP